MAELPLSNSTSVVMSWNLQPTDSQRQAVYRVDM